MSLRFDDKADLLNGKVLLTQLPSPVIIEVGLVSQLPTVGAASTIYIITTGIDINKQYRWNGTTYVFTTDNTKANIASPTFTGIPAADTAVAGTSTTQLATTAFVTAADTIIQTQVTSNTNTLTLKADLVNGKVPTSQLPDVTPAFNPFNVSAAIRTVAVQGTYNDSGELQGVQPLDSVQGYWFSYGAFDYTFMPGDAGTNVWIRNQKTGASSGGGVTTLYKATGQNEDGAMTQKSTTDAIALKANIASPTFTGVPAADTAVAGTSTTQLATTAFVTAADTIIQTQVTSNTNSLALKADLVNGIVPVNQLPVVIPLYTTTGQNTDQAMTQKAVTDALAVSISITYSQLTAALAGTDTLQIGHWYTLSDYRTTHTIIGTTDTNIGPLEPLLLLATAAHKLSTIGYSLLYLSDIVYYTPDNNDPRLPGATKGFIYRRIDNLRKNDIEIDFRMVKSRRWETALGSGIFTITDDTGGAFQDGNLFHPDGYAAGKVVNNTWRNFPANTSSLGYVDTVMDASSYMCANILDNGVMTKNTLINGNMYANYLSGYCVIGRNVLTNSGAISGNVLTNNSSIVNNKVSNNSLLSANILTSSSRFNDNTLRNYSYIVNNTMNNSALDYTTLDNTSVDHNTLINCSGIPTGSVNALYLNDVEIAPLSVVSGNIIIFNKDAEYLPITTGTYTLDVRGKKAGVSVRAYVEVGGVAITIPTTGFQRMSSTAFDSTKENIYSFCVGANGKIQYYINQPL